MDEVTDIDSLDVSTSPVSLSLWVVKYSLDRMGKLCKSRAS
jgi:hypothetical protein